MKKIEVNGPEDVIAAAGPSYISWTVNCDPNTGGIAGNKSIPDPDFPLSQEFTVGVNETKTYVLHIAFYSLNGGEDIAVEQVTGDHSWQGYTGYIGAKITKPDGTVVAEINEVDYIRLSHVFVSFDLDAL